MATGAPQSVRFRAFHAWDRNFAAAVVVAIWLGIVVGFGLDIIDKAARHRLDFPLIVHLHALTFGAWLLLLAAQVWLVRTRRVAVHRRLGMAVLLLLPLMVVLGPATAISLNIAAPHPSNEHLAFMSTQMTNVLGCAVLITAGFLARHDPSSHKRLMLMGTIAITEPGFSRIWAGQLHSWFGEGFLPYLTETYVGTIALMLAVGGYDLVTRGRLHPAWIAAFLWVLGCEMTATWLFYQPFWLAWMKTLTGH